MKLELQTGDYGRVTRALISNEGGPEEESLQRLRSLKQSVRQNNEAKLDELIAPTEHKDTAPRR
jgi:hypothetical protein